MKFAAHQTFYLKTSWIHKGLVAISKDPKLLYRESAVEELGMGKNMVESLRYWLEATQLANKVNMELHISHIAYEIFQYDPFLELDGSLQLIHYLLASNEDSATVFYWFFNKFSASEFDSESLNIYLQSYILTHADKTPRETTLSKDINCLLKMYCSEQYDKKNDPETNNPSPFIRFRWIKKHNNKYLRQKSNLDEISPLIFTFSLYLFWTTHLQSIESINIEDIASKEGSPGLIFGLSLERCVEIIDSINKKFQGKYFEHNRSGGYFIVNMKNRSQRALKDFYQSHKMITTTCL